MDTLNDLGKKHGTDKSSEHHDYLRHYEHVLAPFRDNEFTLMELGVGPSHNMGKSLLTWAEFFPKAQIVGVDIRPDTKSVASDRILIEVGDCGDPDFLTELVRRYRPTVVVDDASHAWSHQVLSFEKFFPALPPGGVFICEDLHTSFAELSSNPFFANHSEDAASYYLRQLQVLLGNGRKHASYEAAPPSAFQSAAYKKIDWILTARKTMCIKKRGQI